MVYLLTPALLFGVVTGSKRTVKEIYRPFGPKMCKELRVNSVDSFSYCEDRLSCHRIPASNPIIQSEENILTSINEENMMTRSSSSLAHLLRDGRLRNRQRQEDTSRTKTSSHHVIPNTQTTLFSVLVTTIRKVEGESVPETLTLDNVAQVKIKRLQHKSTTDSLGIEEITSFKHNPNITLHEACEIGKLDEVKYILSEGLEDINCEDKRGMTPVMIAAAKGHEPVFDFLLSHGCNLSAVSDDNDNLLHLACEGGNTDIVRKLIDEMNYDIERPGYIGWTPVMYAVHFGNKEVADELVRKGCNLIAVDVDGDTLLHTACLGGHVDMVKYILYKHIVSINVEGCHRTTPVMTAALMGHVGVVDLLKTNGCDMKTVDDYGNTILHLACSTGRVNIVRYIIKLGILSGRELNKHGQTPVQLAQIKGHQDVVALFKGRK